MNKSNWLVIGIFLTVISFLFVNSALHFLKPFQPKITVTAPNIIIQTPAKVAPSQSKVIVKYRTTEQHKGFFYKLKHLF